MAPIAGRPFLAFLLEYLERNGVGRTILAVGYRFDVIRRYFGHRHGGMEIVYSVEDEPLGTGGALRLAMAKIEFDRAFVLNGDTFLRVNYQHLAEALQREPGAKLAVALRPVDETNRYGVAKVTNGRIAGFSATGSGGRGLINAGSYVMSSDILADVALPSKFSWEREFLERRIEEMQPVAYECDVPFIDIGIPEAFARAQTLIPEWIADDDLPGTSNREGFLDREPVEQPKRTTDFD
jgi:D-glycero-alpha-D-manno-heptose 1-phosphate guanylyltransferase